MDGVDPKEFEFVLSKIDNGFIFEKFASSFLSSVIGYNFIPHGGIKDKGIDGLEHIYHREGYKRQIYQMSIDKSSLPKAMDTLVKLAENGIEYDQLIFVTNQFFKDKHQFVDQAFERYKKPVRIYDIQWFSSNINVSEATVRAYRVFIDSHLYEFNKPGKSYIVGDFVSDPRLFVFLRQQRDSARNDLRLDQILSETLIIFALEDTDPSKGIVKTADEINETIKRYIKFDPKLLKKTIRKRLSVLSSGSQKKIQYHKKLKGYCLPYETRLQLQKKNIEDLTVHDHFQKSVAGRMDEYLKQIDVKVRDCVVLVESLLNKVFYDQGMEFSDFVLKGENQDAVEKMLPDFISATVEESSIIPKNRRVVKSILLMTIRDIVYQGTEIEKEFLKRLANTYMMLFLVQCDPKLVLYFSSMASRLNIYVGTSIIIPALSEIYGKPVNRRHWNLLKGAFGAGVSLIVNETIMNELVNHFIGIISAFKNDYRGNEEFYVHKNDTIFVKEIMIRAYFYAKMKGKTSSFNDFLDNFIDSSRASFSGIEASLIIFLKEEFGIKYFTNKSRNIHIDSEKEAKLVDELKVHKNSERKAKIDARLILAIYAFREKRNEKADRGMFGYKTWWLSQDVLTHKVLCDVFQEDIVSCYIRADFLYNYISLAPKKPEVDEAFKNIFPTLVGVNISAHIPVDIVDFVHQQIKEHKTKNPTRLKNALGSLSERLLIDTSCRTREYVGSYMERELKE
ncbi:MAG: hypothetical protein K9L61_04175 [Candidatus Omnitrophica bacterium]|nr:hypothetical protein [Candidatus Omnitrophota bacterium]